MSLFLNFILSISLLDAIPDISVFTDTLPKETPEGNLLIVALIIIGILAAASITITILHHKDKEKDILDKQEHHNNTEL